MAHPRPMLSGRSRRCARPLVWALLVAAFVAMPRPATAEVVRFALILGNNIGDPASEPLRHAERDAEKMQAVLSELGDIPSENMVLLTGADVDGVRAALDDFEQRFARVREDFSGDPGDEPPSIVFLLFYSGHGTSEYLELAGSQLRLRELRERLRASGATVRLAILDSCYSGAMIRAKGGRRAPSFPLVVDDRFRSEGYAFMTSASEDERSQESDELRGSFFTHFLASGLRGGADFSGDGRVTFAEAYRYTYHQTLRRSALTGAGAQHPHVDYEMSGEGELVLTRLEHANAALHFPAGSDGSYLLYAPGSGTVVAELAVTPGGATTLAVPAGDYLLFERQSGRILSASFTLAENETHIVAREAMAPISAEDYRLKGPLVHVIEPRRFSFAPKIGYQGVFDASVRSELMAPALLYGMEAAWEDVGIEGLALYFDFLASYGEQQMSFANGGGSQTLLQLNFGLTAAWMFRFGDVNLALGPRLAGVYVRRDVSGDTFDGVVGPNAPARGAEDAFTVSPGAVIRFGYRPLRWLALSLEGRVGYLRMTLDGAPRDMGYGEAFFAASFYP